MTNNWEKDQEFEKNWWDGATNTWWEENKQQVYLKKMGIKFDFADGKFPVIDGEGKTIIDVGGGPVSPLLKTENLGSGYVIDPCDYPQWTKDRYNSMAIYLIKAPAETAKYPIVDECWMMNCLQHTMDPEKIIKNMRACCKLIRVFEWIDEPISPGHPQLLTEKRLNLAFGGFGKVEELNEQGCHGRSYSGIFLGDRYGVQISSSITSSPATV